MPIHPLFHKKNTPAKKTPNTSWEKSSKWYNKIVGDSGHYYHEHTILPGVIRLFNLQANSSVLDVGCGQGVLAKNIPKNIRYQGVDLSHSLIKSARESDKNNAHSYMVGDATLPLPVPKKDFTHAAMILCLQNMENAAAALKNVSAHLAKNAKFVIVLNHPMFRIPRQSGWDLNQSKQQYRWVTKYLGPMKIPIQMHPGKGNSELTWSFHEPLANYTKYLQAAGLAIEVIEEWSSDKTSTSKFKDREDTARAEIPLFMCIVAKKIW